LSLLDEIVALSHEFGTPDYVRGGGGNTSCKTADTLWVKPSGTTLAGMTPSTFVVMSRAAMQHLYAMEVPADSQAREALVKEAMAASVMPGQTGRPSVEAPLHELLPGTFVVHTHPAWVNGMTCSKNGAAVCARLFPDAFWIPYIDPGFTLCVEVRKRVQDFVASTGKAPSVLFLENHGIFVTGNTPDEIRTTYRRVMDTLRAEYVKAGVDLTLAMSAPAGEGAVEAARKAIAGTLGAEASAIVNADGFAVAEGPVSPDHIVYSKSFAYQGELTAKGVSAFQSAHGYRPKVIMTAAGIFGVSPTLKQAALALELARDGALVCQLARAFGGIQFMTDRARSFIENWEVESYRQKQV
jgi:rhamnose utilization protein RhaD (predicted bifunctional aldolase and dehydrogenase)